MNNLLSHLKPFLILNINNMAYLVQQESIEHAKTTKSKFNKL